MEQDHTDINIAETLARVLPDAKVIDTPLKESNVFHVAVPKGFDLKELDGEKYAPAPRFTSANAVMGDSASFIDYVRRHATDASLVWCNFNPQTFALSFKAVLDEHAKGEPAWRRHTASFTPGMSAEWNAWTSKNTKAMEQVPFAEFLEQNEGDIASLEGYPTSLQMMAMATEFEARQDMRIKSMVKLQSGGVQMEYVNDADAGTTERMKLFDKFCIGIPVFWSPPGAETVPAYPIVARLRYRLAQGKVMFWYDLVRADLVHQKAATALIGQIRDELGNTPMLLGACT